MHSMWCQAPLLRPEPPVALRLADVPRKTHVIAPDCSSSILYSVDWNVPLRTRSKSPDVGREKVLSQKETVTLADESAMTAPEVSFMCHSAETCSPLPRPAPAPPPRAWPPRESGP